MYGGKIVQFGTPTELFEKPNHTFVGFFIGSPGMNIIEVERCEGGVLFSDIAVRLDDWQIGALERLSSTNVKLGIRPEFIELSSKPTDDTLEAQLLDLEDLGTYKIATVCVGTETLKVRQSEDFFLDINAHVYLSFPRQWLMLYVDEYLITEQSR
jgi:glycerol transport system ATP-binding protein